MTVLKLPQVLERTAVSKSGLYRMMSAGAFPRPIKLGERAVGWRSTDIDAWLASREETGAE